MCTIPILNSIVRESYSPPEAVYETLKRSGMDLVTVTDHDSIGSHESLSRYPDFFLSEEVTCRLPSGTLVHLGVYDIAERQHLGIQARRDDLPRLLAYLNEQEILFSLNHPFSSLTGRREPGDFEWFSSSFPNLEVLNGHLLPNNNRLAKTLARACRQGTIAGSDAHTVLSLGSAFTEVPGARNREEFIRGLRSGMGRVHGRAGSYWNLTRDVLLVALQSLIEKPILTLLAPFALAIPAVTLLNCLLEARFVRRYGEYALNHRASRAQSRIRRRSLGPVEVVT